MAACCYISLVFLCLMAMKIEGNWNTTNVTILQNHENLFTTVTALQALADAASNKTTELVQNRAWQKPLWVVILTYALLPIAGIGVFANFFVLFLLIKDTAIFSDILTYLVKHQSAVDGFACLLSILNEVIPFGKKTYVEWLDKFLCHAWYSIGLFWVMVSLSIWNLVLLTIERYLAVCKPLFFMRVRVKFFKLAFIPLYIYIACASFGTSSMENRYVNGHCYRQKAFDSIHLDRYRYIFVFIWYCFNFAIPFSVFLFCYTQIIKVLVSSQKMNKHGMSRTLDKAKREITKMAIFAITVFIILFGTSANMFLIINMAVLTDNNTWIIGKILNLLNAVANPFIYTLMIPAFRHSAYRVFCCKKKEPNNQKASDSIATGNTST